MIRVIGLAATATLMICSCMATAAEPLSGKAIKELISGKRVYLSTPYGVELPMQYSANGTVRGDVSGISIPNMFAPRETGKWWIAGNGFCQQWPTWYDGRRFCFTIEKRGPASISWRREDGLTGTARIE
jgi:hypothetical protein